MCRRAVGFSPSDPDVLPFACVGFPAGCGSLLRISDLLSPRVEVAKQHVFCACDETFFVFLLSDRYLFVLSMVAERPKPLIFRRSYESFSRRFYCILPKERKPFLVLELFVSADRHRYLFS